MRYICVSRALADTVPPPALSSPNAVSTTPAIQTATAHTLKIESVSSSITTERINTKTVAHCSIVRALATFVMGSETVC